MTKPNTEWSGDDGNESGWDITNEPVVLGMTAAELKEVLLAIQVRQTTLHIAEQALRSNNRPNEAAEVSVQTNFLMAAATRLAIEVQHREDAVQAERGWADSQRLSPPRGHELRIEDDKADKLLKLAKHKLAGLETRTGVRVGGPTPITDLANAKTAGSA